MTFFYVWHWSSCGCDNFCARMTFKLKILKYLSSRIMVVVFHSWFLLWSHSLSSLKGLTYFIFFSNLSCFCWREHVKSNGVWDLCCWVWPPTHPNPSLVSVPFFIQCQSTSGFMWDPWKNGFIVSTTRNSPGIDPFIQSTQAQAPSLPVFTPSWAQGGENNLSKPRLPQDKWLFLSRVL